MLRINENYWKKKCERIANMSEERIRKKSRKLKKNRTKRREKRK